MLKAKKDFDVMKVSKYTKQNDEQSYNNFLLNYPYDDERKNFVQSLMQKHEYRLTRDYNNMIKESLLKNPNKGIIYYRIWAFSVCDMILDKMIETKNTDEKEVLESVLNELKIKG